MDVFLVLLVLVSFSQGCHAANWTSISPADGAHLYVCTHVTRNLTLPWVYVLSKGDNPGNIHWFFRPKDSPKQILAINSSGNFLVTPAFSQRVKSVPDSNAGILLVGLTAADSGQYSVEVDMEERVQQEAGRGGGGGSGHQVLRRSVNVQISDGLMTEDGRLHISQTTDPVVDPTSDQWSIQLTCGTFTFAGPPAFSVEWLTPSGQILSSTSYGEHRFNLLLTNPIKGGDYTCRVPYDQLTKACLHGDQPHQGEATLHVDSIDTRLSLLETENRRLKRILNQTQTQLTLMEDDLARAKMNQSMELTRVKKEMAEIERNQSDEWMYFEKEVADMTYQLTATTSEVEVLKQQGVNLSSHVDGLESRLRVAEERQQQQQRHKVSFHASGLVSSRPARDSALVFNVVHHNAHHAYSGTTGIFTAPVPGLYFFVVTTGSATPDTAAFHAILVDNDVISGSYSYCDRRGHYHLASAHALVSLRAGQMVWVASYGTAYYGGLSTTFTGFLVFPDL